MSSDALSGLMNLPFELECDVLMQTREAGSARRKARSGKRKAQR